MTERTVNTMFRLMLACCCVSLGSATALADTPLPPLATVVERAAAQAPVVAAARARERQVDAWTQSAQLSRWQNPYFEARTGAAGRSLEAQLDLWFPFEAGDQPAARRQEAQAASQWWRANTAIAQGIARAWAVRTWGAAVVAAARVRLLSAQVETARGEAEALQKRAKLGDIRDQDAQLARVEQVRHALALDTARADLVRQLETLSLVLAEPVQRVDAPPEPPGALPLPDAQSLTQLPEVTALQQEAAFYAQARSRIAAEAQPPWIALLGTGRDVDGNLRLNAGVAWTLPTTRTAQVEQSRAQADRLRALADADRLQREAVVRWRALHREERALAAADSALLAQGRPAAEQAVTATHATWRAGKADWLQVLMARRNLAELDQRHLDLLERRWALWAAWTELTGLGVGPSAGGAQ